MLRKIKSWVRRNNGSPSINALEPLPPLRKARAEALLKWLDEEVFVLPRSYAKFEESGWERSAVDQAIDDLIAAGLATVITGHHGDMRLNFFVHPRGREAA
jgi:hypothetical protein